MIWTGTGILVTGWLAVAIWGQAWLAPVMAWVEHLGAWGPVLFILIYIAAAVFLIPASVLTLGAGAAFGFIHGLWIVSVASTLGAAAAFLTGRFLVRGFIAVKLAGYPAISGLEGALSFGGWKLVLLTRLSPVLPYTLLNYAFSLTRIRFSHFVLATWAGMIPGKMFYLYLGSLARAGADPESLTPVRWALYGLGLAATLAVTVMTTRMARQALARVLPGRGVIHPSE